MDPKKLGLAGIIKIALKGLATRDGRCLGGTLYPQPARPAATRLRPMLWGHL